MASAKKEATIRRGTLDDAPRLARIHIRSREQALPWLPRLHTEDETVAWMSQVILPTCEVWVVERDGTVQGYLALAGDFLEQLYVDPPFQGRGIGVALLAHAQKLRRQLRLFVFQRNEGARRLYERAGFKLISLTDGGGNEEREPDALYEWRPSDIGS